MSKQCKTHLFCIGRAFVAEWDISRLGEHGQMSVDQFEGRIEMIAPEVIDNPYEPGSA
jgi:hypothetical protein